jgi:carboxyl-terminal processing protease
MDEVVRRLKGEIGTSVSFTVLHGVGGKAETFTVQREVVHVDTVKGSDRKADDSWNFMLDPERRIGYIRLTAFSRETAADLKRALEELERQKMRGLILDLRFNPGGLLTSAIEVSDMFVSEGRIVSTKGRNTPERVWDAVKPGTFEGFPMVVLVNHYSASASEIVSACLQDHNRAAIVGDRTWGKGSVQNVIELEDGKSALKLTTATYTRPNGHNIHRFPDATESDEWGVKPNEGLDVVLNEREKSMLLADWRQHEIAHGHPHDEGLAVKPSDSSNEQKPDSAPDKGLAADGSTKTPTHSPAADEESTKPSRSSVNSDASATKTSAGAPQLRKAGSSSTDTATSKASSRDANSKSVDRQLQKALDYLNTELARAQ